MQFSVQNGVYVSAELAAANDYPHIRLFTVGLGTFSVVPLGQLQTIYQEWTPASNTSVGDGAWGGACGGCHCMPAVFATSPSRIRFQPSRLWAGTLAATSTTC